jgi:hypothetical protein
MNNLRVPPMGTCTKNAMMPIRLNRKNFATAREVFFADDIEMLLQIN